MSDIYESGLNPVDSDTGSKDIYFSNEDFAKKIRDGKKAATADSSAKTKKNKKGNPILSTYLFFIIVIVVSMLIS
ncbi:MAG: hypothetical protein K2J55_05515, partial [Eubacterium sp.]|nr:hypothetical protein [Eubacterium sp.]